MNREIGNPPRTQFALTMIVATLAIGIIGIVIDTSILMITVMSFVMALILVTAWYAEFDKRPTKIFMEENGIWLYFRRRKRRFVEWSEIGVIHVFPPDKNPFSGRFEREAKLVTVMGWWVPMTSDVVQAIMGAYTEVLGKPPHVDWRDAKR